ncbi:MAG: GNAT family N-acetyltransferase [Acidimicrobiia bacterium]
MPIEIRPLTDDDLHAAHITFARSIQVKALNTEHFERRRLLWWAERSFGAFDGTELVGHAGGIPFDTLLPGGREVATDGVTRVGVLPSHRRRGILTALMRAQLQATFERGEPLASLRASESVIYPRFGYGLAGMTASVTIDTAAVRFVAPPARTGSFHYLRGPEVLDVIPPLYERCRRRPGALTRPAGYWEVVYASHIDVDDEDLRWLVVHRDERGRPDGFVEWTPLDRDGWEEKGHRVQLVELWGLSPAVEAVLWRFVFELDLVHTVVCDQRPLDDELRWMIDDARAVKVTDVFDEQWLRLVDARAVLGARAYSGDDEVVLEITDDPIFEHNVGRFAVGNAGCTRVRRAAEIRLDVSAAAAVSLGGTSFEELARAGRIEEARKGAVQRADRLFASRPLPFCSTFF